MEEAKELEFTIEELCRLYKHGFKKFEHKYRYWGDGDCTTYWEEELLDW